MPEQDGFTQNATENVSFSGSPERAFDFKSMITEKRGNNRDLNAQWNELPTIFEQSLYKIFKDYKCALNSCVCQKTNKSLQEKDMMELFVKGTTVINGHQISSFEPILYFYNLYNFKDTLWECIMDVAEQCIFAMLSPAEKFNYMHQNFPFWQRLKRTLLVKFTPDQLVYEHILETLSEAGVSGEKLEHIRENCTLAKNYRSYRLISNDTLSKLIYQSVFKKTGQQFNEYMKHWFLKNNSDKTSDILTFTSRTFDRPKVTLKTLYTITYSLDIVVDEFSDMLDTIPEMDLISPDIPLYMYAIKFNIDVVKNTESIQQLLPSSDAAFSENVSFFDVCDFLDGLTERTDAEFKQFLKQKMLTTQDGWKQKRQEIARNALTEIVGMISSETLQHYTELASKTNWDILSQITDENIKKNRCYWENKNPIQDTDSVMETIKKEDDDIDEICQTQQPESYNKSQLFNLIGIGKNIYSTAYLLQEETILTARRIEKILDQADVTIDRDILLQIAYLYALLKFINGSINPEQILDVFIKKANELLSDSRFPRYRPTFRLDALFTIAFSCPDVFYTHTVKALLPHKKK